MDDKWLLKEFVESGSEKAFAQITERHLHMVYATCFRELRDSTLAEDATQIVFLVLAHKARSLRNAKALASWLFITSRNVSRKLLRQERRRMSYEQEAVQQTMARNQGDKTWDMVSEELNDALAALKHSDREIILRRFCEGMSFKEAGEELQISENTARVRSTRAVERLRRHLAHAGVAVPIAALISLLTAKAANATPRTLPRPFLSDPRLHHLAKGAIRQMFLTKLKIAALLATVMITSTAGIYLAHNRATSTAIPPRIKMAVPPSSSMMRLASDPVNAPDMAGSQIIQKCKAAYNSVQTFEQDAQSSMGSLTGTAHIIYQRPGNLRVSGTTLSAPGMFQSKYDMVCQGDSDTWVYVAGTWSQQGSEELGLGAITGISGTAGSGVPALLVHDGGWGDPTGGIDDITSVSTETLNGQAVYRVIGASKDMTTTLWIDQKTFFLVKTQEISIQGHKTITITVTYSTPEVNQPIPPNTFSR